METKDLQQTCHHWCGGKRRKVVIIVAVFALLVLASVAAVGKKLHERQDFTGYGQAGMMGKYGKQLPSVAKSSEAFVAPADAVKSGEIAIIVNDISVAQKNVATIANKNNGNVYSTFISYAAENSKSGSIIVQVPMDQFEKTYAQLKTVGTKVVQESSQNISQRNYVYPMMTPAAGGTQTDSTATGGAGQGKASAPQAATPDTAIAQPAIYPSYPQSLQDKGYIRVVLADYGNGMRNEFVGAGVANNDGLWLLLGFKIIVLIALLAFLIVMIMMIVRIIRTLRSGKKKTSIPSVKHAVKPVVRNSRVIKRR